MTSLDLEAIKARSNETRATKDYELSEVRFLARLVGNDSRDLVAEVERLNDIIVRAWASIDHHCEAYRILTSTVDTGPVVSRTSVASTVEGEL